MKKDPHKSLSLCPLSAQFATPPALLVLGFQVKACRVLGCSWSLQGSDESTATGRVCQGWVSSPGFQGGEGLLPFGCKEMALHFYHCSPVSHNLKEGHCCQDFAGTQQPLSCFVPHQPCISSARAALVISKALFPPKMGVTDFLSVFLLNTRIPILIQSLQELLWW